VVVSGAAGAVGSIVGQIAKIKGCTVIGIAGSDEKGKWLVEELQFDRFINYKDKDFEKELEEATPKDVDCYFDNVGGEISNAVMERMNQYGRISVCGSISGYNSSGDVKGDWRRGEESQ
jgi:prostaglandin reductase 1